MKKAFRVDIWIDSAVQPSPGEIQSILKDYFRKHRTDSEIDVERIES